jgi:hypothetical protein
MPGKSLGHIPGHHKGPPDAAGLTLRGAAPRLHAPEQRPAFFPE